MLSVGVCNECGHTNVPISLVLRNSYACLPRHLVLRCDFDTNKYSSDFVIGP